MYRIVLEETTTIYDDRVPDKDFKVLNPVLEMNGNLTFTVPPVNRCYSTIDSKVRCMIRVYKTGQTNAIWTGRIISIDTDIWNQKKVTCENAISFFADCTNNADTVVYYGTNRHQGWSNERYSAWCLLRSAIEGYNNYHYWTSGSGNVYVDKVEDRFKIQVGTVTAEVPNYIDGNGNLYPVAESTSKTCLQNIKDLQSKYGGYIRVRDSNGLMFLDWLKESPRTSSQVIDFGKNIMDFVKTDDIENIFTVIHPLGDRIDTELTYGDVTPSFSTGWWITDTGEWQRTSNTKYFTSSTTINVDEQMTYYYSGRMKGNYAIYAILDASDNVMYVGKSGAEDSSDIKSFERQKIEFPAGAKKIRYAWYQDDDYKYKDDQGNEHVHPVSDYTKVERTNLNEDAFQPRVDISSVNNHSPYLFLNALKAKYGWIERTVIFDNINQAGGLMASANRYIQSMLAQDQLTIEVKAIDLSLLNVNTDDIRFLDSVRVRSKPHGIDLYMPVTKMTIPLDKPEQQTFTLGVRVRKRISELVRR